MADMNRLQDTLPTMLALARERTEVSRVELAGLLAEVCLDESLKLSMREQELVNELIDQLIQARTPAVRAQLVQKFADSRRMPRKIALGLASENIEIARNVLSNCLNLSDEDLITVVERQSSQYAEAIAVRSSISEAVADALVITGDIRIMQLVAENLGAHLSPKAVDVVTDAARFAAELRDPIMHRVEMTSEAAIRLYWWVSQDLRRYALKKFNISAGQVDLALTGTIEQLLGYYDLEKTNDEAMIQVADWLSDRQAVSSQMLSQVLRLGHFRLFDILLSRLTHLSLPLIDTIVMETGGRGVAVICRALNIDKAGFVSIFLLSRGARAGEQIVHPRELSYALAAYDRLSSTLAQDLLNSWKKDPSYFARRIDPLSTEN